jgi:DNA polymerase I-like protein with 3'-5' exonuclease and polymerase domains
MFSLIEIDKWLYEVGLQDKAKIITTVHDSIILEVDDDKALVDYVAESCTRIMAETPKKYIPDCVVPFKADAEIGYSYGKLEGWKEKD